MQALIQHILEKASEATQSSYSLLQTGRIYGGDINQSYKLVTTRGNLFLKINSKQYSDMLQKEANGLLMLAAANHTLTIPKVIHAGETSTHQYLLLNFLEPGQGTAKSAVQLGEGLAMLHTNNAAYFGLHESNYIGSLEQRNTPCGTWHEFYITQRLQPFIQKAFDKNLLDKNDLAAAENLYKKLPHIFPKEKPALLHGDLWSGNYMYTANGSPAIFDPAVYYGHREMDIAMTMLFGGFDAGFYAAYQLLYPLQSGWQQRVALCQLYPLLVHLLLFGSAYYGRVKDVLKKFN